MSATLRPAWVEINLGAIAHNTQLIADIVAPAHLCAVVKADAYGHGAVAVAPVMLAHGASMLAVALVDEGLELRKAGIDAPVLVLTEAPAEATAVAIENGLTLTIYRAEGIHAAVEAARRLSRRVPVHVKVDTGMHRVGADPEAAIELCRAIVATEELELVGLYSHFAVADVPEDPFSAVQLTRLLEVRAALARDGIRPPIVHLANSAGSLGHPEARLDMVRSGILLYGHLPAPQCADALLANLPDGEALMPAFSLRARVHLVRDLAAGERTSYGRFYELGQRSRIAVVPLGYNDGVPRRLAPAAAAVLIGGRRRPIAGTVTMDQLIVDCGEDDVNVGDEVVLVGRQGGEEVTAEEWAEYLETIPHEIFGRIGPRVARRYVGA